MQYRLKNKKTKYKLALKKMKELRKQQEAESPKVVNIKRGRKKAVA